MNKSSWIRLLADVSLACASWYVAYKLVGFNTVFAMNLCISATNLLGRKS